MGGGGGLASIAFGLPFETAGTSAGELGSGNQEVGREGGAAALGLASQLGRAPVVPSYF